MEVKVIIDRKELKLIPVGQYQGYVKFISPKEVSYFKATVFVKGDLTALKRRGA